MSYAEYGTRIFFSGIHTKPQSNPDTMGHKLKMIESCSDTRAWSSDPVETFRYFREMTERGNSEEIDLPNPQLNAAKQDRKEEELELLRRELAKYKMLDLTNEQKKKLGNKKEYDDEFHQDNCNVVDGVFRQFRKLTGINNSQIKKPISTVTDIQHINNKKNSRNVSPNPRELSPITETRRKVVDLKSSTDISFSLSQDPSEKVIEPEKMPTPILKNSNKVKQNFKFNVPKKPSVSSLSNYINFEDSSGNQADVDDNEKNYNDEEDHDDNDHDDDNSNYNDNNNNSRLSDSLSESDSSHVLNVETVITTLENDLSMKNVEVQELKEENKQLKQRLTDREEETKFLKTSYQDAVKHFKEMIAQSNKELNDWKEEVFNGRSIIDQLRKSLEDKRLECDNQSQQLNNLKHDSQDVVSLKSERDMLANTFEEITNLLKSAGYDGENPEKVLKRIITERNELLHLKNNLELNCLDKEDEMAKIHKLIYRMQEDNDSQKAQIKRTEEELSRKLSKIDYYKEQVEILTKQCLDKTEMEKSLQENELIDGDCDQAFANYFKQSMDNIHELTKALKDAGDDVGRRKIEIKKLKKQMDENIRVFKEQLNKKSREGKFYRTQYEECQKIIDRQINEIENLKRITEKLEKKLIYSMEMSVNELHQEHNNLTTEIQHLTSCIHDRNVKIIELENERENLLIKIDSTSAQLDEKNIKIEALKEENSKVIEKLDESKKNIEDIFNALEALKFQIERVYQVSLMDKKILMQNPEKKKFDNLTADSAKILSIQNTNKKFQDSVRHMLNQTECLENKITTIKDGINDISYGLRVNIYTNGESSVINLSGNTTKESELSDSAYLNNEQNHDDKQMINEMIVSDAEKDFDEIKNSNHHAVKSTKQGINDLNLPLNDESMNQQNLLKQNSQYFNDIIKTYCGDSTQSKGTDVQSFNEESGFLSETPSLKIKQNIPKSRGSEKKAHVVFAQFINDETSNERFTDEEIQKPKSPTCKQFILHCGERLSNEKYG